ncbi:fatty-acyl-CoA synthase [Xylariaceae sp. FL0594]|nr:fatty-acyl-CoA synthase [Xylariaceae sp. FL0594]
MTAYHLIEDRAATPEGASDVFLIFEGLRWTYGEFYDALQPVGNWLIKDLGVQKGDVVLLDGGNTPEYLMISLALEAVGAVCALLNCNLTGKVLVHSVKLSTSRYVLADEHVRSLVSPVEAKLKDGGVETVYYSPAFFETLKDMSPLPKDRTADLDPAGLRNLLYTSGTTGLPKAVSFPRGRALLFSRVIGQYLRLKPGEVMYTCLPLYHASALALCTLPCMFTGAAVCLGRKFSHATFWPEVRSSRATVVQYVGELCRYLVNAPPSPLDKEHCVRVAWGNGMRPDVWERFRDRFGIECINELYGASDGMHTTLNANRGDFTANAIALRGALWHLLNRFEKRVLIDPDTQEVLRGKDGWAILAKADEAGEVIVRLNPKDPDYGVPQYYNNKSAVEKRRIRDVFRRGDVWYRSGDLFREDSQGRVYFVDRLGDTFRWHSENVSTSEVGDVVGEFAHVAEANVYGVLVPHADGRAGCAAVVPTDEFLSPSSSETGTEKEEQEKQAKEIDLAGLATHCLASLPRYAVPIFLRVVSGLDYTGTYKLQKQRLRAQGIDLDAIARESPGDRMYWLPPGKTEYVPFTEDDFRALKAGNVRL